ncbi:molybdenum cofactor guanylyltransferase [Thalassotalea ganghwensis]
MTLGVVLSGGKSTRMGIDKGSLRLGNQSMLEYAVALLSQCSLDKVVVSGDQHDIPDVFANLGPLSGIYSVVNKTKPSAILVLPIDMPLITPCLLKKLLRTGENANKACFFKQSPLPLYLPCNNEMLKTLMHLLKSANNKGPSIKAFISGIAHISLDVQSPTLLKNCNTPQEWHQALALMNKNVDNLEVNK